MSWVWILVVLAAVVELALLILLVTIWMLVVVDDARQAERVVQLRARTPVPRRGFHGGPTQYDEHGRVKDI